MPFDVVALAEHPPGAARGVDRAAVDEQERALEAERLVAPAAIGESDDPGAVRSRAIGRQQQRLALGVRLIDRYVRDVLEG